MTGKTKCSFQLLIYPRNQLFACQTFFLLFDDLLRFVLSISFFRCVLASLFEVVSVGPSDGWIDGWMVTRFFLNAINEPFSL